jgi:hypothetical protein
MMATVSISPPSELIEMTSARIYRDALSARIDQGRLGLGITKGGSKPPAHQPEAPLAILIEAHNANCLRRRDVVASRKIRAGGEVRL